MEIIFILLIIAMVILMRLDDTKQEKKDDVTIPTNTIPHSNIKSTGSYKFSSGSGRLRNPNGSLRAMRRRYTR